MTLRVCLFKLDWVFGAWAAIGSADYDTPPISSVVRREWINYGAPEISQRLCVTFFPQNSATDIGVRKIVDLSL